LGLTLVAEGIERNEQAQAMREMGVSLGQGFLYQRPQPLEAVLHWLEAMPANVVLAGSPSIAPEFAA
jgi:sensor c-di-GMP phosphodiesterase-like protein